MTRFKKLHCVTCILMIFFAGCWNKQDHHVTRPDIPFYSFSGKITDWDSDSTLAGVKVVLTAAVLVYDVDSVFFRGVSDSLGNFLITPVYPGKYFLHFERDGYPIGDRNFQVDYSDINRDYRVPKIYLTSRLRLDDMVYSGKPMAIHNTTCWFFSTDIIQFKYENSKWVVEKYLPNILKDKNIKACTIIGNNFYVTQAPDSIIVLNRFDGSRAGGYAVSANLTGLAYDKAGERLFSCSRTAIFRHDVTIGGFAETWTPPVVQLEALAWKEGLYSYDNSEQVLKRYDNNMNVIATYALIDSKTGRQIEKLTDMDFDAYGNLWISGY